MQAMVRYESVRPFWHKPPSSELVGRTCHCEKRSDEAIS
jgi:hypothetical protein